jgi:hypothetical protein
LKFIKTLIKQLSILALGINVMSCVEPYNLKFSPNKTVLLIDANITDEAGKQIIKLSESKPDGNRSNVLPVPKAQVEVLSAAEKVLFVESTEKAGEYISPANFKALPNVSYVLKITLATGEVLESNSQKLLPGSPIKKTYQELKTVGSSNNFNVKLSHNIYIDTDDPATPGNYYLWNWVLYEHQEICKTCNAGQRYYRDPYPGVCVSDLPSFARNNIYDYKCNGNCWEIFYSSNKNIMSDEFVNGKTITGRLVADIPLYQLNSGALIEIKQHAIDYNAYRYFKIIIDQYQNSGGLADTPPSALIGNITSKTNPEKLVAGYFWVSDETKIRHWIDRRNIISTGYSPPGIIGKPTNLEPSGNDTTRPPLAPCINGFYRTNIKPEGWML